jgi:CheY-like chemotaxis protein
MGGEIQVHSVPGQGSTFEFALALTMGRPMPTIPTPPTPIGTVQSTLQAASDALPGLKVLLVEDHPINQKLAISLMERSGHQVTLAQNGEEGLQFAMQQAFDLALMDMQMPVMDGLECTRAIRAYESTQSSRRLPIIAMTANALPSDRLACEEAGMDGFLSKPFKADELRQLLAGYQPQP